MNKDQLILEIEKLAEKAKQADQLLISGMLNIVSGSLLEGSEEILAITLKKFALTRLSQ
jgi:hypothetical protein